MSNTEDIAKIEVQESTLTLAGFSAETAWQLGTLLRELAIARGYSLVIDVRRFGSPHQQLFFCAVGETPPDLARWIERKVNVVARFHKSSYLIGRLLEQSGLSFAERYGGLTLQEYATHGGGFPLHVAGTGVVGAVTVSGLPQREDHSLVVEALCLLTGRDFEALRLS